MSNYYKTSFSDLIIEKKEALAWITLNRPKFSNSFSDQMIVDLCHVLREADWDEDIRTIVITGAGKSFCAGGDVKAMEERTGMFAGDPEELRRRYSKGIQQIPLTMESLQTPVVAMVNGAAIGAGCDLACMCDIRIGCQHSRFGETFAKLALVPGDGGAFFLQRVIGYAQAMELSLTGRIVDPEEALKLGLLNQLVDQNQLRYETEKMVNAITSNSPVAVAMIKKASAMPGQPKSLDTLTWWPPSRESPNAPTTTPKESAPSKKNDNQISKAIRKLVINSRQTPKIAELKFDMNTNIANYVNRLRARVGSGLEITYFQ